MLFDIACSRKKEERWAMNRLSKGLNRSAYRFGLFFSGPLSVMPAGSARLKAKMEDST